MGYDVKLTGSYNVSYKVSEKFLRWFQDWCKIRHMPRIVDKVKEIDRNWVEKTPAGNLGDEAVLYCCADESTRREDLPNYNNRIKGQEDYYFPLVVGMNAATRKELKDLDNQRAKEHRCLGAITPIGTTPEYDIYLEATPTEKPCGIANWLKFMLENKDIMQNLGEVSGVMLAVGEEFGDATYYVISRNEALVYDAYSSKAKGEITNFLHSRGDGLALHLFEKVYMSPQELEYEWDEDDY